MAQSVRPPYQHGDLCSHPQWPREKLGSWCVPAMAALRRSSQGDPWGWLATGISELQDQLETLSQKIRWGVNEDPDGDLHPHLHTGHTL